jgi:hypothetical protein
VTSISDLVERVVASIAGLVVLGETIQDEWTYVHDLELVWVARLRAVAAERTAADDGTVSLGNPSPESAALTAAVERLCDEASRITDPHRAIDWLSTLPQATLVALGETAW